jgi:hypothetical protein
MTERQWLTCSDPARMVAFLSELGRVSDRKWRLLACACSRIVGEPDRDWKCWENGEAMADGLPRPHGREVTWLVDDNARGTAEKALGFWHPIAGRSEKTALLRDIVAPFRSSAGLHLADSREALSIAQAAYDEFDFDRLPILADALEEAGCADEEVLRHLRGQERCPACFSSRQAQQKAKSRPPRRGDRFTLSATVECDKCEEGWIALRGPHIRGCWALDLVLVKQ